MHIYIQNGLPQISDPTCRWVGQCWQGGFSESFTIRLCGGLFCQDGLQRRRSSLVGRHTHSVQSVYCRRGRRSQANCTTLDLFKCYLFNFLLFYQCYMLFYLWFLFRSLVPCKSDTLPGLVFLFPPLSEYRISPPLNSCLKFSLKIKCSLMTSMLILV